MSRHIKAVAKRTTVHAKSEQAKLSITDWTKDGLPNGEIGQSMICNFVQVHPYFSNEP